MSSSEMFFALTLFMALVLVIALLAEDEDDNSGGMA